jgi:hypothetical protein
MQDTRGSFIGGGEHNIMGSYLLFGAICGGLRNSMYEHSDSAFIGAGTRNEVSWGRCSVLGGGESNTLSGAYSVILGGRNNEIREGLYAVVLGGESNMVEGMHGLAGGRRAKAIHDGAFVRGDSTDADVESSASDQFTVRAAGGARFFSSADLATGVVLAPGDGSWANVCDRNAKQDFQPVDGLAVLEKVAAMPLSTWSYRAQGASVRHMGPMAQDFKSAFGVGSDDQRITTVDADGVALAAIQGLNQKLRARETEIAGLRQQNDKLEHRLAALESLIAEIASERFPGGFKR